MAATASQSITFQDLWPLRPLYRCHPSWLPIWFNENPFMLDSQWNWQQNPTLNKWANRQLPEWRQQDWDWLTKHGSFWTQSPATIAAHFQFIGAVFCHRQLSSLILKQEIEIYKSLIKEQAYAYCKQQAPVLMASWPETWHQQVDLKQLAPDLFNLGLSLYSAHWGVLHSKAVQARIRSWYPTDWHLNFATADFLSEQDNPKLATLLNKIEKHRASLCLHL